MVGAGGALLHVYGWTTIEIDVKGEKFSQSVVIVDPLATETILGLDVLRHCVIDLSHEQLITGAGHVVNLYCKEPNRKQDSVEGLQHEVAHPVLTKIDCKEQSQEQSIVERQQHKVDHPTLVKDDSVLFVRVVANSRIPSFSEMEILGTVVGEAPDKTYLLQSQLKDSDVMIATAAVTPGDLIPMRVMNPTDQLVMLYKGTKVASLCRVEEVVSCQQSIPVSAVHGDCDEVPPMLEEVFHSLLENLSLTSDQQDILFSLLIDYANVFAVSDDQLGRTNVLQHEIHTDNVSPIRQ